MDGRAISSKPMLTLLRSPPLIPRRSPDPILESAISRSPSWPRTVHTRSAFSSLVTLSGKRRSAANKRASRTAGLISRREPPVVNYVNGDG